MKTMNNDEGSLKVGTAGANLKVGDRITIAGEGKFRTITFIMGKGEKTHLCFKAQGKVPMGEVDWTVTGEVASTEVAPRGWEAV